MRLAEYYIHVYNKKEAQYIKWHKERPDGTGSFHSEEGEEELEKPCNLCKTLQNTSTPWTKELEIKYFHKPREQLCIDKMTDDSIHTLMPIALKRHQNIRRVNYRSEENVGEETHVIK